MPSAAALAVYQGPTVTTPCPSCGQEAACATLRTDLGLLLAQPASAATLRDHADCDLWGLSAALSRAAVMASQVAVHVADLTPPEG